MLLNARLSFVRALSALEGMEFWLQAATFRSLTSFNREFEIASDYWRLTKITEGSISS